MKRRILILIILVIILIVPLIPYGKYSKNDIVGTYVNNYSKLLSPDMIITCPSRKDTLILFDDMRFESSWYGKGKYHFFIMGSYLYVDLNPDDPNDGGYDIPVSNKSLFDRTPRLYLNSDANYFYIKIK